MKLRLSIKDIRGFREYREDIEITEDELLVMTPQRMWESYVRMIERMDKQEKLYKEGKLNILKNQ